jgi:hypothetical protein
VHFLGRKFSIICQMNPHAPPPYFTRSKVSLLCSHTHTHTPHLNTFCFILRHKPCFHVNFQVLSSLETYRQKINIFLLLNIEVLLQSHIHIIIILLVLYTTIINTENKINRNTCFCNDHYSVTGLSRNV